MNSELRNPVALEAATVGGLVLTEVGERVEWASEKAARRKVEVEVEIERGIGRMRRTAEAARGGEERTR